MKKVQLIAGSYETINALKKQIFTFLPEALIDLTCHSTVHERNFVINNCDLVIFSSDLVYEEAKALVTLDSKVDIIVGKRTLNFDYLQDIISIPKDTKVLLVNDLEETSRELIKNLKTLGLNHLNYLPYYPSIKNQDKNIKYAITPGEEKYVPNYIEKTINIGPRLFDFTTIAKILNYFDFLDEASCIFSDNYLHKLINLSKNLALKKNETEILKNDLKNILDGFKEGLLAFNLSGHVTLINNNLKKLLKIRHKNTKNIHLNELIYNKKLLSYLLNDQDNTPFVLTLEGQEIFVQKINSNESNNAVVSFKYDHQLPLGTQNTKELSKGYSAKYRFENIIGESNEILKAKKIAKRLAPSDITILIEGDSGTGKELFASSIHNHSARGSEKFLAINFSALPDDLIESELFGYVDGAFTGAKKGGKKGLFEEADGGTIFLDEIGDVSFKVQTRLLRVLEEKEIMPIGSNKIIPINVRVIAATNKDLEERVSTNEFRKDLYYRLKMGYIHLPSLKERKSDIPSLAKHLIDQSTVNSISLSENVVDFFKSYDWPGNIRELKNIITYMIAYSDKNYLTMEDLPQKYYFKNVNSNEKPMTNDLNYQLDRNEIYILNCINDLIGSGTKPSRKKISVKSEADGFSLSINQVRRILNELEELDLIIKRKGRYGTNITQKGLEVIGF